MGHRLHEIYSKNIVKVKRADPDIASLVYVNDKYAKPKQDTEAVYLVESPNYCTRNLTRGMLGTKGRACIKDTSDQDADVCDVMCCGRGYDTRIVARNWKCNCRFHWCCYVKCKSCSEKAILHTSTTIKPFSRHCSQTRLHKMLEARKTTRSICKMSKMIADIEHLEQVCKILRESQKRECRCHGPTASCFTKTCWKSLPGIREIGEKIHNKVDSSQRVRARKVPSRSGMRSVDLLLDNSGPNLRKPNPSSLVFFDKSPTYCDPDLKLKIVGTSGRVCNRTTTDDDNCALLCCGRGYDTHEMSKKWLCNCRFEWCCRVICKKCKKNVEVTRCK